MQTRVRYTKRVSKAEKMSQCVVPTVSTICICVWTRICVCIFRNGMDLKIYGPNKHGKLWMHRQHHRGWNKTIAEIQKLSLVRAFIHSFVESWASIVQIHFLFSLFVFSVYFKLGVTSRLKGNFQKISTKTYKIKKREPRRITSKISEEEKTHTHTPKAPTTQKSTVSSWAPPLALDYTHPSVFETSIRWNEHTQNICSL